MPSKGTYKIYIIDEVHMLSTSAFNALLKTLEEPPQHVIFIFATTEPQKIPVTILSRCQRFDFRRIPTRKVVERLKTITDAEGVKAEQQALWLIGRESEGSMRDSQSLLDQVITFCGKNITHKQVVDVLGLTDRTLLSQTLGALISRNVLTCLDILEKVFHLGYDPKQFAQDLLGHLRNLMIVKVTGAANKENLQLEFLDLPDEEIDELKKMATSLSDEDVHLMFDMTLKGVSDVVRAQDPRIVLEMLMLRLSQAPRITSIDKLLAQVTSGTLPTRTTPGTTPAPKISKATPQTQTQAKVAVATDTSPWPQLLDKIKKERPLLAAKLEYAALKSMEGDKILLNFRKEQEFLFSQVNTQDVVGQLIDIMSKNFGRPMKIEFSLSSSDGDHTIKSPVQEKEEAKNKHLEEQRAKVEEHPLIKEAKNTLKAKITSVKEST
jgi:DNA polymerase-3 subunit gamma/tau